MGFGIFPSGCLANHSCDPNATWFLQDGGAGTAAEGGALLCVRALRAVAPGEPKAPAKVPAEIVSLQLCVPPLRAPSVRQQG
ncbi:MAG: SET domain-containing protein-lysine N-methyltransferase [Promethearchaeia archaeon]